MSLRSSKYVEDAKNLKIELEYQFEECSFRWFILPNYITMHGAKTLKTIKFNLVVSQRRSQRTVLVLPTYPNFLLFRIKESFAMDVVCWHLHLNKGKHFGQTTLVYLLML